MPAVAKDNLPDQDQAAVSVYCRIRPFGNRDEADTVAVRTDSKTAWLTHAGEVHNFAFDRVFDLNSSQQDVYDGVKVTESVRDVLGGYNATIFAYGQTASGKTHTMEGIDISDPVTRGIIPRSATSLFLACSEAPSDIEFAIKVSFVEIYMERIRDLLDSFGQKKKNLQIREDPNLGIYVAGCTEAFVTNEHELLRCMTDGHKSRATAATGMNEGSSRSHSVLTVTVQQRNTETDAKRLGKLVLVDLAGSEMIRKTQAAGQQLEEAKKINKSLSALGQVINALTDEKKMHVPYRDSKLTRMLQDSLGGNAKTALIIAVSPSTVNSSETLSTLKFGQRAKSVRNKPKINERRSVEELTALLLRAEAAIDMQSTYITALELQATVQPGRSARSGGPGATDDAESMATTILELQQKISMLNEELVEERAEARRCSKETWDLTAILHEKERLLVESGELMREVEAKMEETVRVQVALAAENEKLIKEKAEIEIQAQFKTRELELRLEKVSAVDARLRKEDADDAAISQRASCRATPNDPENLHSTPSQALILQRQSKSYSSYNKYLRPDCKHAKLVADLTSRCEIVDRLQRYMNDPTTEHNFVSLQEGQHMRSLQQRLDQLVAVHRQLLRKYAALELNLGEASKVVTLRDERIVQLERQSEQRFEAVTAECQCLSTRMKDLDIKLLNRKSALVQKVSTEPRTLRGGQRDNPTARIPRTAALWWNR
mmetsp:Transcript_21634/g.64773  ORF Transcript_21634/g.64773 Transcript_21634/m.64773 type:complete len:721 (+) Transcript_21634:257-2419(+)